MACALAAAVAADAVQGWSTRTRLQCWLCRTVPAMPPQPASPWTELAACKTLGKPRPAFAPPVLEARLQAGVTPCRESEIIRKPHPFVVVSRLCLRRL